MVTRSVSSEAAVWSIWEQKEKGLKPNSSMYMSSPSRRQATGKVGPKSVQKVELERGMYVNQSRA